MKKINSIKFVLSFAVVFGLASCDKGFVEKNRNPYAATSIDPAFLFSTVERNTSTGAYENEQTIVQQFVTVVQGAATGYNFNASLDIYNNVRWNQSYNTPVKYLEQIISAVKSDPNRNNLYQMARIMRAYNFIVLVDSYGDVPYSEAGKAYLQNILRPKYDKSADIYNDIYNELKSARAALNITTSGDAVPQDIFYGGTGVNVTVQAAKWQRLAGSLMVRLGSRYTKIDAAKATTIINDALSGPGVIASNADNMFIPFNNVDNNPLNGGPRTNNPSTYYVAEPFVNHLKATNDPRAKFMIAKYANPGNNTSTPPDLTLANQFGFPIGYDDKTNSGAPGSRTLASFRGAAKAAGAIGFDYSQLNFNVIGSPIAPIYFVTYAQTQLLLADARQRGVINTGDAAVYYENGIRRNMEEWLTYPGATPYSGGEIDAYLAQPNVSLATGNALEKINNQYWVININVGNESWANFRRTGFPTLTPNDWNTNLSASGGFVRRMAYPQNEPVLNPTGYQMGVASMGGDGLTQRVFWDKQ